MTKLYVREKTEKSLEEERDETREMKKKSRIPNGSSPLNIPAEADPSHGSHQLSIIFFLFFFIFLVEEANVLLFFSLIQHNAN